MNASGDAHLLEEGQVLLGTYEVERLLGEGAFGEVYRVKHKILGRQAMKVLKATGMTLEEIKRLLDEALLLTQLDHPNIIRVFDANVLNTASGPCGYFTMQYVAGGSLDDFWKSHGDQFVPVETAVELVRQICRGLNLAHSSKPPIVHRDIKPQNILVGYDAQGLRARISDFGLAKHANPMTLHLSAKGTTWFKPPEVFTAPGGNSDSPAGDVWAVGSTLYLLLTDRLPYFDPKGDPFDKNRFASEVAPPSRHNAGVDARLDRILARSLAKSPKARYATAGEMLKDLEEWRPQGPPPAKTEGAYLVDSDKQALGAHSSADEEEAQRMAGEALQLAQQADRLAEAADLMEQALNAWPALRAKYEYKLKLWRRGFMM